MSDEDGNLEYVRTERLALANVKVAQLEHALRAIADGEVPGVTFAEDDLVSAFAQETLDTVGEGRARLGDLLTEIDRQAEHCSNPQTAEGLRSAARLLRHAFEAP